MHQFVAVNRLALWAVVAPLLLLPACGEEGANTILSRGQEAAESVDWAQLARTKERDKAHSMDGYPIEQQADIFIHDVSDVSGLPILQRVPVAIVGSEEQALRLAEQMIEVNGSEAFVRMSDGLEVVLDALGLETMIPNEAGDDSGPDGPHGDDGNRLAPALPPPGESTVLGFYDPTKKAFFISETNDPRERAHTIRHELMHALQDQSFDLVQQLVNAIPDIDQVLAIRAVVEGQAEVAAVLAAQKRWQKSVHFSGLTSIAAAGKLSACAWVDPAGVRGVLPVHVTRRRRLASLLSGPLRTARAARADAPAPAVGLPPPAATWPRSAPDIVYFPYREGSRFIEWLLRQHDGASSFPRFVRETLEHPPRSTREIYHPIHYLSARAGVRPRVPSVAALQAVEGYSCRWESALGELILRGYLWMQSGRDGLADAFVADRLAMLSGPDAHAVPVVAWLTRWQSPYTAAKFVASARIAQRRVAAELRRLGRPVPRAYVAQDGAMVGLLLNVPREANDGNGPPPDGSPAQALVDGLRQAMLDSQ